MSLESRLSTPALHCGLFLISALLIVHPITCHAFTLDVVSHEMAESGQGPHTLFVPGYGEVVFESGLDGVLVVDSAYASTEHIEVPPPASAAPATQASASGPAATEDPGYTILTGRTPDFSPQLPVMLHPVSTAVEDSPGGWNAVPEAASAALGLVGTVLLFMRRRVKPASRLPKPPGNS